MSDERQPDRRRVPADHPGDRSGDSLLRGGLRGIALVFAATVGVALVAGLLSLVISALY